MATQTPDATVILPVHNAERYLANTVKSVLAQDHGNFEFLMLDDGSTDGSLDILHRFARQDSRCVVRSHPNRGVVATRNEGIQMARADVLLLIDADDICHPDRFSKQLGFLKQNPACVALGSEVMLVDPDGRRLRPQGVPLTHAQIDSAHMQGVGGMIVNPVAAMRKPAVLEVGGYRPEFPYAEDFDLFLRLAEVGQLANLPDILLDYRQHFSSVSHRHKAQQLSSTEQAIQEAHQRRGTQDTHPLALLAEEENSMTPSAIYRRWAWWALSAGNVGTARRHSLNAIRHDPFTPENFRLLGCALRGH